MPRNGEGFDDIAHPGSEAESGDDGYRALSRVRDVLREHQFKTGIPKAPNPHALMKHAKKLNGQDGSASGADEINVRKNLCIARSAVPRLVFGSLPLGVDILTHS